MKKVFLLLVVMLTSIGASAQFTVYRSATVPERSTNQDYGPFTVYQAVPTDPMPYNSQRAPQPKTQKYTLTGYYKNQNGWQKAPIKVSVTGDVIKLIGIKIGNRWSSCSSNVNEVGAFETEEVKDNFTYKGYVTYLGSVYF